MLTQQPEMKKEQKTEMRVIITDEWLKSLPDEEPNDWSSLDNIDKESKEVPHVNLLNNKSVRVLTKSL
jgi:hypothetical protein